MSRKQFIESQGATCCNWQWSWSFINENEKVIIFGAWDCHINQEDQLILSEEWEYQRGRKQPGYTQAINHIGRIEEEGYQLMTFPLIFSDVNGPPEVGPARIGEFVPEFELTPKTLKKVGNRWYACPIQEK